MLFNYVPLTTRQVLLLYKVYGDSALLLLNGTSLNNINAHLVLNGHYTFSSFAFISTTSFPYVYFSYSVLLFNLIYRSERLIMQWKLNIKTSVITNCSPVPMKYICFVLYCLQTMAATYEEFECKKKTINANFKVLKVSPSSNRAK